MTSPPKTLTYRLSETAVTELSSLTAKTLKEGQIDQDDAKNLQIAVEKVLLKWLSVLGEGSECTFRSGGRLGRQTSHSRFLVLRLIHSAAKRTAS